MTLEQSAHTASAAGNTQAYRLEDMVDLEPQDAAPRESAQPQETLGLTGTVVARIAGLDGGYPLVEFDGAPDDRPLRARSTVLLTPAEIGREVVVVFERGDVSRPLVMGLVQMPATVDAGATVPQVTVQRDGERLVLSAEREIVLQCGKASIVLTRAGKVLIRGAYISSRSSGVNRVKGGSVQIN